MALRGMKVKSDRLVETYKNGIKKNWDYIFPTATTGVLMTVSDLTAQIICEDNDSIDWVRTLRFAAFGYFIGGPLNAMRFRLIDRMIKDPTRVGAVKKMLIDQSIVPPLYNFLLFSYMGVFKQLPWEEIKESYTTTCVEVTVNSYKIFPPAVAFAFFALSPHRRTAFLCTIGMLWNTYLSHVTSTESEDEVEDDLE